MNGKANILVTGGAGYVGSHTIVELLTNDYNVIAIDNLVNCYAEKGEKPESLKRVEKITGKQVGFYDLDIRDKTALQKLFQTVWRNIIFFNSFCKYYMKFVAQI